MPLLEIVTAGRVLAPIIKDIYQGAKGELRSSFDHWKASNFSEKLAKKIAITDKVKTIWRPDKDSSLIKFYYPSQIIVDNINSRKIESVKDFGEENIVIEGIVGQGKSIFLRYLCLQELPGLGSGKIPIFLELRTLICGKSLRHYIYQSLDKLDLNMDDQLFDYLAKCGKIVLMLDGFDELDANIVKEVINEIEYFVEKYNELQIIITSRPENEIQKSRLFKVVEIAKLTENDYSGFLIKLNIPLLRRIEIINAIKESPSKVNELINTPLMLTLLVMVYETEKEIPTELPEFFEKLFHVVFTKHDKLKAGFNREHHSGLSERELQEFFEAFCFMVMQNGFGRRLTSDQFLQAFSQATDYTSSHCKSEKFKLDITKVACLMLEEGFNIVTFLHKSILEYYAAAFIKHAVDEVAKVFYEKVGGDFYNWIAVLSFLQKIDTYRKSRYYIIPTCTTVLKFFNVIESEASNESLIDSIKKIFPNLRVVCSPSIMPHQLLNNSKNHDKYHPSSFGPFHPHEAIIGEVYNNLVEAVTMGLQKTIGNDLSLRIIKERQDLFIADPEQENVYNISFKKIAEEYCLDSVVFNVRNFLTKVEKDLAEAKIIVEIQEKKKSMIFLGKN
jgi:NACHT domain